MKRSSTPAMRASDTRPSRCRSVEELKAECKRLQLASREAQIHATRVSASTFSVMRRAEIVRRDAAALLASGRERSDVFEIVVPFEVDSSEVGSVDLQSESGTGDVGAQSPLEVDLTQA